jgi:MFS family permease
MLIDRANIGNVRIEGILEDLHMKGNDYNVAILVYTVPFMLFELPSSLALRSFRPAVWISLIMFGWGESFPKVNGLESTRHETDILTGICTIGAGLTRSYEGLLACRFLVGCFEAGFAPCQYAPIYQW